MSKKLRIAENSPLRPFVDNGCSFDGFSDLQVLALILEDILGRKKYDIEKLAEALLADNRTLGGVVHASSKSLTKYMDFDDVVKFKQIGAMHRYIMHERCKLPIKLSDNDSLKALLSAVFFEEREEVVYVFPVVKGKIVAEYPVESGSESSVSLSVRSIRNRLENTCGCTEFIMAHNHPDGNAEPSEQDMIVTGSIYDALGKQGYKLLVHYIYTKNAITPISPEKAYTSYFFFK